MDGIPKRGEIALVVIDVQEKFRPAIFEMSRVIDNCSKLIKAFRIFGMPVIITEQYPQGLGPTVPELAQLVDITPIQKNEFSCFDCARFTDALPSHIRGLVICGIEAHVCILQTVLDAIHKGYEVYMVEDAISSRKENDWRAAAVRAGQSGAYRVSTEMIIFQLMGRAGTDEFKEIQELIR